VTLRRRPCGSSGLDRLHARVSSGHWRASAGRSARVCGALRSSRWGGSACSIGGRRTGCKLHVRGHGRVVVACDAADGAALDVCGVQLVRAEQLPAVAVPQPRLFSHSAPWLDVRVEQRSELGHSARPLGVVMRPLCKSDLRSTASPSRRRQPPAKNRPCR
jgi:hypothetical protein